LCERRRGHPRLSTRTTARSRCPFASTVRT
jgi:hypothetical protein